MRARRAGDPQTEKDEVPGHECREHLPEPDEADRVDRS
jgi:hypothetical protein